MLPHRLSSHEDGLESDAQRAFAEVKAEALTYKGYSDEEVLQLVQQECAAPLAERRAAALSLLSQVSDCWHSNAGVRLGGSVAVEQHGSTVLFCGDPSARRKESCRHGTAPQLRL